MEIEQKLDFMYDIFAKNKLTGIAGNLMDGLQWDMIDLVKSGNNPVGAIDKRLTATKEQAITLAKKYKLVP